MLLNFALEVVGTKVSSDKVSTDGYECSNLISSNYHLRGKGFLAEHFIKPPVNITFEFPCYVNIHHIVVTPRVGQQRSSHLELYSASHHVIGTRTSGDSCSSEMNVKQQSAKQSLHLPTSSSTNASVTQSSPVFHPIGKMSGLDSDCICFYNPRFSGSDVENVAKSYPNRAKLQHPKTKFTSAASHITLRIFRTYAGSAVALSNVQILGQPARSVPIDIIRSITSKYTQYLNPPLTVEDFVETQATQATNVPNINSSTELEFSIPDEFVDPITCEIMAVPMLLPSGKNVDLSTIDRFNNTEASCGRAPRDPFTGVEFSNASRPLPNGALKSRIDQFLTRQCNNKSVLGVARTVGVRNDVPQGDKSKRKADSCFEGVSSLVSLSKKSKNSTECHASGSLNSNHVAVCQDALSPMPQSLKQVDGQEKASKSSKELERVKNGQGTVNNIVVSSHETKLKDSLDSALSMLLDSVPSNSNSLIPKQNKDKRICPVCKGQFTQNNASYLTPCQHLMCHKCLTSDQYRNIQSVCCEQCGISFKKCDVVRKHFT